jgi:hypothetical protein
MGPAFGLVLFAFWEGLVTMRVTPDMRAAAGDEKVAEFMRFAVNLRCVVIGDSVTCTTKQKKLLEKKWRELNDG